jgi:hypothetical protein
MSQADAPSVISPCPEQLQDQDEKAHRSSCRSLSARTQLLAVVEPIHQSRAGFQNPILTQHGNSAKLCLLYNKEVLANLPYRLDAA